MCGNLSRHSESKGKQFRPCPAKSHGKWQPEHALQQHRAGARRRCCTSKRRPNHDPHSQVAVHDSGRPEDRRNQRPTSTAGNRMVRTQATPTWQCLHHTLRKALPYKLPADAAPTRAEHTRTAIQADARTTHGRHQAPTQPTTFFPPTRCHRLGEIPQQTPSRSATDAKNPAESPQRRSTQPKATQEPSARQPLPNKHEHDPCAPEPKRIRTTGQNQTKHKAQEPQITSEGGRKLKPTQVHFQSTEPASQQKKNRSPMTSCSKLLPHPY